MQPTKHELLTGIEKNLCSMFRCAGWMSCASLHVAFYHYILCVYFFGFLTCIAKLCWTCCWEGKVEHKKAALLALEHGNAFLFLTCHLTPDRWSRNTCGACSLLVIACLLNNTFLFHLSACYICLLCPAFIFIALLFSPWRGKPAAITRECINPVLWS